ncbi:iron-containing redox enzyme family protein [Pseudomonas sp. Q1]|uniref:iron-containing redox enzyme family protein n=1 Tax=Pseudomonas sp. Q1 TaxID=2202823 RepID=UPI00137504B1|nr:iron-containing redox enzyme family protein [Pseudomonas sp. Q1]NCE83650.1 iron-containing redox enzyme family protein [Pseudomonas sp. Q1]
MTVFQTLQSASQWQHEGPLRSEYQRLLTDWDTGAAQSAADFLQAQLAQVSTTEDTSLPASPEQLMSWVELNCTAVAEQYAQYLQERQQGGGRRYFQNKAHALYFLQCVAPTKQVDGAWLYGVLSHWQDYRYDGLVTTYLEELGDGEPTQNHVSIYQRLLAEQGCDGDFGWQDQHFHQGAIQLALGQSAASHMPEILGYNLGYEQLPLHLLICAYELKELGIDPYYFSLHVTIDNASSGHARRAVQAVLGLMPNGMDATEYWQRVRRGYQLNDLGLGTTAVIQAFDLEHELVAMLERKRPFAQHMHSDYCRFEGKTVNQWLAQPGQVRGFLQALENKGWIKRNQSPEDSRFWQLVEGAGAAMFGVFSGYEKQLLRDWIAGDWRDASAIARPRPVRPVSSGTHEPTPDDPETCALRQALARHNGERQLDLLLPWLAPHRHHRPAGLYATRRFIELRASLR